MSEQWTTLAIEHKPGEKGFPQSGEAITLRGEDGAVTQARIGEILSEQTRADGVIVTTYRLIPAAVH